MFFCDLNVLNRCIGEPYCVVLDSSVICAVHATSAGAVSQPMQWKALPRGLTGYRRSMKCQVLGLDGGSIRIVVDFLGATVSYM